MSVFGPRDKDVPLLTQLYQLDIPDPDDEFGFVRAVYYHSDLDKWLGRHYGREYWSDAQIYMPGFAEYSDEEISVAMKGQSEEDQKLALESNFLNKEMNVADRRRSASSEIRGNFFHLINIIALVRRIMTSVCDANEIVESDAVFLFDQSKLYRPVPNYRWEANEQGRIPLGNLEVTDFSPSLNGMEWQVLATLEAALNKAQQMPGYFQRCQQCHNVFLRERGQAIYCSRRCNVRAQTQRWRQREAAKV